MVILSLLVLLVGVSQSLAAPKRSEGFFGLHLDFHAIKENDRIGENVTEKMVQNIIDAIHPDYIQVDGKGHPGYSSFMTNTGRRTNGYVWDQLKIWRKVTHANNIPLTAHYSSLYDIAAIEDNPQWAFINYKGTPDKKYNSMFSPIAQELIIPQLKELRRDYDLDAVWIDGECWGVQVDYCPAAQELFKSKYGDVKIPTDPKDELYFEYLQMLRQKYREFLAGYLKEMKDFDPDFEIASNWAYSSFMPEKCTLDVDWLSGDLPPYNSVNSARLEARCLRHHHKKWDLMSWGFFNKKGSILNTKTPIQLQQEAASVIAQGGGYQVYFSQVPDGSVRPWQINKLVDVAKFCRERQTYCQNSQPVLQTAVLFSTDGVYRMGTKYKRVFGPWGDKETGGMAPIRGIIQALSEAQVAFDLMMEHQIIENLTQLDLIIIPEWPSLEKEFKNRLIAFAQDGGSLLAMGPQSTKLFENELGVTFTSDTQNSDRWLGFNDSYACYLKNDFISVQPGDRQTAIGTIRSLTLTGHMSLDPHKNQKDTPAATVNKLGKGQIAGIYIDFGRNYALAANSNSRDFLKSIVDKLLPEPLVKVAGSHYVDVIVNKVDNKLAVNLVNTAGPHADNYIHVFDDIPPVGPLQVSIKTPEKPKSITLQPANIKLEYTNDGKYSTVTIASLKLHQILIVE